MTMERTDFKSQRVGSWSSRARMPSQMVGTPAATVTRSATMRSRMDRGSRWGPGKTIFEPAKSELKGRPQAAAWNIGTTGRMASDSATPMVSFMHSTSECSTQERWL